MKQKAAIDVFAGEKGLLNIIIETPKGSRNKYAYDPAIGLLRLKKSLPCGMVFPFDFGCLPGTKADDGDPLDILVLMEEKVSAPCLVQAHLIGIIEAEQSEKGESERNDRLVAVATSDTQPTEYESVKTLPAQTLKEIERFFVSYNELSGKKFKVLNYRGPRVALKSVQQGVKRFQKG